MDISGLSRFTMLGCLDLSFNDLSFEALESIKETHIIELFLHGAK